MTEPENEDIIRPRCRFFIPGPPLVLLAFALASSGTVLVDLIVYRTCLISLNISYAKCLILRTNASSPEARALETEVEPHASMIIMAKSLLESILPAVLSLFLGPWSDRGGRRPLLVAGFTGLTMMYAILSLMCNWDLSPWYLLIPSIPACMLGGFGCIMFASICYISDTTPEKNRTMYLAWIQASILCGYVLGTFIGPLIFKNYGYTTVFTTATICCILGLIYTYFCIPETVKHTPKESLCGLFKLSFVKELVTSSLVKRNGFHRPVVWLAFSILTLWVLVLEGEISIGYLFVRERLGWDVQHYSYVLGLSIVISMTGVLCGVTLFSRILGLSDTSVATIGLISSLGCSITKSFTSKAWHMYLGAGIALFGGVTAPVIRSIISKSVPSQDLGKMFSLVMSFETLSPLAGAPLYTLIYSHYLPPVFPSPVYLLSVSLYLLLICLVVSIEVMIRKSRNTNYIALTEDVQ